METKARSDDHTWSLHPSEAPRRPQGWESWPCLSLWPGPGDWVPRSLARGCDRAGVGKSEAMPSAGLPASCGWDSVATSRAPVLRTPGVCVCLLGGLVAAVQVTL